MQGSVRFFEKVFGNMKLPQGFDLHAVEVFVLTAELGGMTQSAQHLGLTQSAVSQTIAKLENALGTVLFDRSLRPLALTAGGRALFDHGRKLVENAKGLIGEVRFGSQLPIECVTFAMAESLANLLTAPFIANLGERAAHWKIRSGISQAQHAEFLARKIDMLLTGSSSLENTQGFDHHSILDEPFILVLPASHTKPVDLIESLSDPPFIRYSMLSGMGQRIERQIARMKLNIPNFVEVDSTFQQLTAVGENVGWSITTPMCVAGHVPSLDRLRLVPMPRGQFSRKIQLVSRTGDLGDLPESTAQFVQKYLREHAFPPLVERFPWLEPALVWDQLSQGIDSPPLTV